ncbi:MFS transporter [Aeromicrobium wangtongii]|uniref:MFS transporter n=1 Tax=Aeromicrobium wangtongii TaxID=2969247 RepID=UPI00201761F0|nr:MFS transporter [Aeromicrobium wangtongii]MCL3820146.1 MFS transporter [Aeromicrobium wangtongii]
MTIRTRFWFLAALRWLPTGLVVPVVALLPLERGLSVAEMGAAFALQGVVVLCLELPTGALTDVLGRRPVFVASAVAAVGSYTAFALAHSVGAYMAAAGLAGLYRALDSGPLNAWFVDSVHDDETITDRTATVAKGLSGHASVVGASIATGAVLSGLLVAWAPLDGVESLALPYWIAAGLAVVQVLAALLLMDESRADRPAGLRHAIGQSPRMIGDGVRLLRSSRVLRALVAVELFWGFGIVAFETLTPVRLGELLGDRDEAASIMGPVTAAAWAFSALGVAAVPLLLRRWSMVQVSVALRLLQGSTVVGMGLAMGPVGLVGGLIATYALHSASAAVFETLLHEQVDNTHRATVLSLASMLLHPGASLGGVTLGAIATSASTGSAMIVGGVVLAAAAPLFLVKARHGSRAAGRDAPPMLGRDDGAPAVRDGVEAIDE